MSPWLLHRQVPPKVFDVPVVVAVPATLAGVITHHVTERVHHRRSHPPYCLLSIDVLVVTKVMRVGLFMVLFRRHGIRHL